MVHHLQPGAPDDSSGQVHSDMTAYASTVELKTHLSNRTVAISWSMWCHSILMSFAQDTGSSHCWVSVEARRFVPGTNENWHSDPG